MNKMIYKSVVALAATTVAADASLMFVGIDSDSERFSFLSDIDIASSTEVFFTDDDWSGTAFNDANEGTLKMTLTADLPAGTVVTISASALTVSGASGNLVQTDATFNINGSGDSIYAFTGSRATPTFLGFLTTTSDTAPSTGVNVDISSLGGNDVIAYTGPNSGESDFIDYVVSIQNALNWTVQGNGTGDQSANYSPPTDFSVVAIPEPSSSALLGLGGLLSVLRRKR